MDSMVSASGAAPQDMVAGFLSLVSDPAKVASHLTMIKQAQEAHDASFAQAKAANVALDARETALSELEARLTAAWTDLTVSRQEQERKSQDAVAAYASLHAENTKESLALKDRAAALDAREAALADERAKLQTLQDQMGIAQAAMEKRDSELTNREHVAANSLAEANRLLDEYRAKIAALKGIVG